jgi:hypothetical protein
MKVVVALGFVAAMLAGCSGGSTGGTGNGAPGDGETQSGAGTDAGTASGSGSGTVCSQAAALTTMRCPENVSDRTYAPACDAHESCRAQCVLQYPCDGYHSSTCVAACPAAGSSGGTSGGTSGGMSSGMTSGGTSGMPTGPRPECTAYASTYCGCLGSAAAANCVQGQASQCDDNYTLTPTAHAFYDCVVARMCSAGWLDACAAAK